MVEESIQNEKDTPCLRADAEWCKCGVNLRVCPVWCVAGKCGVQKERRRLSRMALTSGHHIDTLREGR